ncbi:MAG: HAMP domain-containing protein [Rickettsiaceae bacterium]|nr:HAMP domain-containing protein [Rickettsiaceae bacterium]
MSYFTKAYNLLNKFFGLRYSGVYLLTFAAILLAFISYIVINNTSQYFNNPKNLINLILTNLIILLFCAALLAYNVSKFWLTRKSIKTGYKLQARIVMMFSVLSSIPTCLMVIFSVYFFNLGVQNWFDKKVSEALDESVHVAQAYIAENTKSLKNIAISMEDDFEMLYSRVLTNPDLLQDVIDVQANLRSIDEALIFNPIRNKVLAQSAFSFSLAFASIPVTKLMQAKNGEVVDVSTPNKIRILIKLSKYEELYLLIGRLIDEDVRGYLDQTHGAAESYKQLHNNIFGLQLKFSVIFAIMALILIIASTSVGLIFISKTIQPIRRLLEAISDVKKGNLAIKIPEGDVQDEIGILSNSFNAMTKTLAQHRQELIIAQKALAWSDMARMVAHEINNPLTPIRLSIERLQKKYSSNNLTAEEFDRYTNIVLKNTSDINKIVTDFVEFAKLSNPELKKINFTKLIEEMVSSRSILSDKTQYTYQCDNKDLEINCDRSHITQVLLNLFKNAEEALDKTSNPKILVRVSKKADELLLTISDNGPGFKEEILKNFGKPYITTKPQGTGLGLAIVKKILSQHNASLDIFNNENGGANVSIAFSIN